MFKSGKEKSHLQTDTPQKEIPAKVSKKTKGKKTRSPKKPKDIFNSRELDILLTLFVHPFLSCKTLLGFINLKHKVNANTMRRDLNKLSKLEYLLHSGARVFCTSKGSSVVEKQFGIPQLYDIKSSACAHDISSTMAEIELFFLQNSHNFYLGSLYSFQNQDSVSITSMQVANQQEEVDAIFVCANSKKSVLFLVHLFSNPFHFPALARSYFRDTSQKILKFKDFRLSPQDKSKFDALFGSSLTAIQSLIIVDPSNERYVPSNLGFCRILTLDKFKQIDWKGLYNE